MAARQDFPDRGSYVVGFCFVLFCFVFVFEHVYMKGIQDAFSLLR